MQEEKNLSASETLVMKAIWNSKEDIPFMELMDVLRKKYDKDYSRTTVDTFLARLSGKGYVTTYRKGRTAYIHALKSEDEFKKKIIQEDVEFWFNGRTPELFSALCSTQKITKEDAQIIRGILDGLDFE